MIEEKKLKKLLEQLPKSPGVYRMLDEEGKVIYIGKAKELNKRVKQYFKKGYEHSYRTKKLLEKIQDLKWTVVDSDLEAIILELNLIKQFRPKYNVIMKDDKNYVYIKITKEDFPRIQIVRKIEKDNAKYIGPKTAAHKIKDTFKMIKKLFPFRHCSLGIQMIQEINTAPKNTSFDSGPHQIKITNKVIKYPCLDYHIKRCCAPCIGKVTIEEYQNIVSKVQSFLEGKTEDILDELKKEMMQLAASKKFEKAARMRDKIAKVESILEKQNVAGPKQESQDIINYCIAHNRAYFNLFQVRNGKLLGQENFILSAAELDEEDTEALQSFITQYYELATDIPKEILIPHEVENQKQLTEILSNQAPHKVKFLIPQKGKKDKLLEMSLKNALIYADRNKPSWEKASELTEKAAEDLQKLLEIPNKLKRIECYDISHLSGTETVGSMIVFTKGAPGKSMYRKFRLRTVQGKPDDYKSMKEVLKRRFLKIAQAHQHKEYKFKKAGKKDLEFVKEHNRPIKDKSKAIYILHKEKKPQGFIALKEHSPKITELTNFWLKKELRGEKLGYKILSEAIKKAKSKRIYIICKKELKDYYQIFGFEEVKKIPKELEKHFKTCESENKTPSCLVYDKIKHKEDKSFSKTPDLIIIDGGKGQLSAAQEVLKELQLTDIPHISLAKKQEEIFRPNKSQSILLERNNEALKLIQRARDEAHRFAITYNKQLRSKKFKPKA